MHPPQRYKPRSPLSQSERGLLVTETGIRGKELFLSTLTNLPSPSLLTQIGKPRITRLLEKGSELKENEQGKQDILYLVYFKHIFL